MFQCLCHRELPRHHVERQQHPPRPVPQLIPCEEDLRHGVTEPTHVVLDAGDLCGRG